MSLDEERTPSRRRRRWSRRREDRDGWYSPFLDLVIFAGEALWYVAMLLPRAIAALLSALF
jgi:hypothetical protein